MLDDLNLDEEVTIDQTSTAAFTDRVETVNPDIFVDELDQFSEILKAKEEDTKDKPVETEPDSFYDLPEGVTKYLLMESKQLLRTLAQLTPVIHLNATRAVSRGISIKSVDEQHIEVISPNDMFYFKTTLEVENKLDKDEILFIEYLFLQRMAQFIPSKVLIYFKEDKYYFRFKTNDLELQNTYLIDADIKKLDLAYNISDEVAAEIDPTLFTRTISSMSKLLRLESDSKHKQLFTKDGLTTFQAALIKAGTKTTLPDVALSPKVIDYLLKISSLISSDSKITFLKTDSQVLRYAIKAENSILVSTFATTNGDPRLTEILTNLPSLVSLDYEEFKYQLTYASAITYAKGFIEFKFNEGKLEGDILLQNGGSTKIEVPILDCPQDANGKKFKLNTKVFLTALTALNPSLETKLGFADNLLFLVNDDVTFVLVCV